MARTYTLRAERPESNRKPGSDSASRRRVIGFSPRQQAIYRRIVDDAWRAIAADARDVAAKGSWYRQVLHEKFGVYTSKQLNKSGDFERACAAFEEIAGNGIYWQMRVNAAPLERMRRKLTELIRDHAIDDNYVAEISRRMFDTHTSNLTAAQLNSVIAELQQHFNRQEAA